MYSCPYLRSVLRKLSIKSHVFTKSYQQRRQNKPLITVFNETINNAKISNKEIEKSSFQCLFLFPS